MVEMNDYVRLAILALDMLILIVVVCFWLDMRRHRNEPLEYEMQEFRVGDARITVAPTPSPAAEWRAEMAKYEPGTPRHTAFKNRLAALGHDK